MLKIVIQFLVIFSELKMTDGENKGKQILYYLIHEYLAFFSVI